MKILEKIALTLFSVLILILSVLTCLLIFGWLDLSIVNQFLVDIKNNDVASNVLLGVSVVCILLAIKCIFFDSNSKNDNGSKDGILLENDNGKLLISRDTLENLVNSVAKGFDSTENVTTKVELDRENNLKIYVTLFVHQNAVIKDLSANLQLRIKEAIKKSSDLDVKEVNIRVRNIAPEIENIAE